MNQLRRAMAGGAALLLLIAMVGLAIVGYRPFARQASPPSSPSPATGLTATLGLQPATPLPDPGIRLGPPREVQLGAGIYVTQPIWSLDLDANTLVAAASVPGGRTIVEIELWSGQVRHLLPPREPASAFEPYIRDVRISGRYVAWVQYTDAQGVGSQLHVLNRSTGLEITPEEARQAARIGEMDLKADLLVWQQANPGVNTLYGADLWTGHVFTPAQGLEPSFVQLCSREWFIYLDNIPGGRYASAADLRARNLDTAEDILVGQVVHPATAGAGRQHGCDGDHVVWVSPGPGETEPTPTMEHRYFNLATRSGRVLAMPPARGGFPEIRVSGDLVIGQSGYSLRRDVAFRVLAGLGPEMVYGGPLVFSYDTVAWMSNDPGPGAPWRLFTATIIRDYSDLESPPTITPGPPPTPGPAPTFPSLANPIDTREEAIVMAYQYDREFQAVWEVPWDPTTPDSDPDRFIILWFPDINTEEAVAGDGMQVEPDIVTDIGPVWSVTITGSVSGFGSPETANGATYVISQRSGILVIQKVGLTALPPTPTPTVTPGGPPVPTPTETATRVPTPDPYP
jgi:hypothetical protein